MPRMRGSGTSRTCRGGRRRRTAPASGAASGQGRASLPPARRGDVSGGRQASEVTQRIVASSSLSEITLWPMVAS
jgi:hypothetical protein